MNSISLEIHELFNNLRRYTFPFSDFKSEIPRNGVYIIFERGERFQNLDRIVRVGTHTGNDQLFSRLNQHFIKENKNRSIFRKNIGRCILNKTGNTYLRLWELDTTSRADKEKHSKLLDMNFEKQVEKQISNYIQTNLSFCVFRVEEREQRLFWETKIASTLAQSDELKPSPNWLGKCSPKDKIRDSGLWQVNGLNSECFSKQKFDELKTYMK
jgi:hypothetical protein